MNKCQEIFNRVCQLFEKLKKNTKNEDEVVEKLNNLFAKHPNILTLQNEEGQNLGMVACEMKLQEIVCIILNDKEAGVQQDAMGCNIGMYCACNGLEKATIKSLSNEEASIQQDKKGFNIGMYASFYGLEQAVFKALQNSIARKQLSRTGNTIESIAVDNGLKKIVDIFYQTYGYDIEVEEIEEGLGEIENLLK